MIMKDVNVSKEKGETGVCFKKLFHNLPEEREKTHNEPQSIRCHIRGSNLCHCEYCNHMT
jgi:hypothetical protein